MTAVIEGIPLDWTQALVLGVALVIGLIFKGVFDRRRARKHTGTGTSIGKDTGTRGSAPAAVLSPGSSGPGATRDLNSQEIRNLRFSYAPKMDGDPDPGEVIWTWVPYVENDGRGKDRPVLILARLGNGVFAGCYLSTKSHPGFIPIGTGGWDPERRESFLAPDRVLRVSSDGMRREGQTLARDRFERAVAAVAGAHHISR